MGMCRLWVAVLACVVVPLVGCSEGEPKAGPEVSSTPSATESASVVPKDESAEEFIRRWFGTQQAIYDRGDSTEYLSMAPECADCRKGAERLISIHRNGGTIDFAGLSVTSMRVLNDERELYEVVLDVGPTVYKERADAAEEHLPGGKEIYWVALAGGPSDWTVASILRSHS